MDVLSRSLAVLVLACAVAAGTLGSTTTSAGAAAAAGDCTPGSDWGTVRDDFASQTIALVNSHRTSIGLKALSVSSALQASAVWKARHMAKYAYMAHNDPAPPVARTTGERMAACGVSGGWGENIAAGFPTPGLGRQRLAELGRSPGEHRERELHGDRLRCRGEQLGADLLGAHLQHERG